MSGLAIEVGTSTAAVQMPFSRSVHGRLLMSTRGVSAVARLRGP